MRVRSPVGIPFSVARACVSHWLRAVSEAQRGAAHLQCPRLETEAAKSLSSRPEWSTLDNETLSLKGKGLRSAPVEQQFSPL